MLYGAGEHQPLLHALRILPDTLVLVLTQPHHIQQSLGGDDLLYREEGRIILQVLEARQFVVEVWVLKGDPNVVEELPAVLGQRLTPVEHLPTL